MSATNAPMAHMAATSFVVAFIVAVILTVLAFVFEILFILTLAQASQEKTTGRDAWAVFRTPRVQRSWQDNVYFGKVKKKWAMGSALAFSLVGCFIAYSASTWVVSSFGRIALYSIVFNFDAASAHHCSLNANERTLASFGIVKALFLSSSQEKALLVERGGSLLAPIVLKRLDEEASQTRTLSTGRVVSCYKTDDERHDRSAEKPACHRADAGIRAGRLRARPPRGASTNGRTPGFGG